MPTSPRLQFVLIAGLALGAVALAVYLQFAFAMEPCAWCTFQRLIYLMVAALALIGATLRALRPAFLAVGALLVLVAAGGAWAALHQHLFASSADSCAFTFADRFLMRSGLDERFPWLFEPTASCGDANIPLLGVPFALWSLALFVALMVIALIALRTVWRERR